MALLIAAVIATFIIAGVYVGYHYSQDPSNFESHSLIPMPIPAYAVVESTPLAYICDASNLGNDATSNYNDRNYEHNANDNVNDTEDEKDGQCKYAKADTYPPAHISS